MNPSELVDEIVAATTLADKDLREWDPRTRPGMEGAKNRAKARLEVLREQHLDYVSEAALVMYLSGSREDSLAFTSLAAKDGGVIFVDAGSLYRRLAEPIDPALGPQRMFGVGAFSLLLQGIDEVAREIGLDLPLEKLDLPNLKAPSLVKTKDALAALIRSLIVGSSGQRFMQAYIESTIGRDAFENRYDQPVVPVIVSGLSDQDIEVVSKIVFGVPVTIKVAAPVSEETINTAFNQARAALTASKLPSKEEK